MTTTQKPNPCKTPEFAGGSLASWDVTKLEAIEAVARGEKTVDEALVVVQNENNRRAAWLDRRRKAGRR